MRGINAARYIEQGSVTSNLFAENVGKSSVFADLASFPATSNLGDTAIALDTLFMYVWDGAAWLTIGTGASTGMTDDERALLADYWFRFGESGNYQINKTDDVVQSISQDMGNGVTKTVSMFYDSEDRVSSVRIAFSDNSFLRDYGFVYDDDGDVSTITVTPSQTYTTPWGELVTVSPSWAVSFTGDDFVGGYYTFPSGKVIVPDTNALMLWEEGGLLSPNTDYTETSTGITLLHAPKTGVSYFIYARN